MWNTFEDDRRYCDACERYVSYLLSPQVAYCARCGADVRLFSDEDRRRFQDSLRRPLGPEDLLGGVDRRDSA